MKEFKPTEKMKCFKEGGSTGYVSRKEFKKEIKKDEKEDKVLVKKSIAMHDKQEHEGEKTDLSKLRKGGRAKKEKGTVKKFKEGGKTGITKTMGDGKRAPVAEVKKAPPKTKAVAKKTSVVKEPLLSSEPAVPPEAALAEQPPMFAAGGALRGMAQNTDGLGRAAVNEQPQPGLMPGQYESGGDVHYHYHGV